MSALHGGFKALSIIGYGMHFLVHNDKMTFAKAHFKFSSYKVVGIS